MRKAADRSLGIARQARNKTDALRGRCDLENAAIERTLEDITARVNNLELAADATQHLQANQGEAITQIAVQVGLLEQQMKASLDLQEAKIAQLSVELEEEKGKVKKREQELEGLGIDQERVEAKNLVSQQDNKG